jgi:hypothetical protein
MVKDSTFKNSGSEEEIKEELKVNFDHHFNNG